MQNEEPVQNKDQYLATVHVRPLSFGKPSGGDSIFTFI